MDHFSSTRSPRYLRPCPSWCRSSWWSWPRHSGFPFQPLLELGGSSGGSGGLGWTGRLRTRWDSSTDRCCWPEEPAQIPVHVNQRKVGRLSWQTALRSEGTDVILGPFVRHCCLHSPSHAVYEPVFQLPSTSILPPASS